MKIDKLGGKLILKNPKIIDPLNETIFQNDVMLDNNKIVEIGSMKIDDDIKTIDCNGLVLTHGFCDLHVHFRDPGNGDKETLESGSKSALAGGFTRVCTMPNTVPTIDTPELINYTIEQAEKLPINIHPIGAVSYTHLTLPTKA